MDELIAEIDRVANNTDFNGIKPLASMNGVDNVDGTKSTKGDKLSRPTDKADVGVTGNKGGTTFDGIYKLTFQIGPTAGETIKVTGQSMTVSGIFTQAGWTDKSNTKKDGYTDAVNGLAAGADKKLTATKGADNTLSVLHVGTTTTTYANRAITAIKDAIDTVSTYRAKLGAAQNRLEHTINNLEVTAENITSAESRIRDTDMADEITNYTKNNILLQAAQSMLSQANAAPQGVLSLLQ